MALVMTIALVTVQNVDHGSHRHRSGMHRGTVAAPAPAPAAAAPAAPAAVELHSGRRLGRRIGLDLGKPHPLRGRVDMIEGGVVAVGGAGGVRHLSGGGTAAGQVHAHGLGVRRRYPRIWRSAGVAAHHTQRRTELHRVVRMGMWVMRIGMLLLLLLRLRLRMVVVQLLRRGGRRVEVLAEVRRGGRWCLAGGCVGHAPDRGLARRNWDATVSAQRVFLGRKVPRGNGLLLAVAVVGLVHLLVVLQLLALLVVLQLGMRVRMRVVGLRIRAVGRVHGMGAGGRGIGRQSPHRHQIVRLPVEIQLLVTVHLLLRLAQLGFDKLIAGIWRLDGP